MTYSGLTWDHPRGVDALAEAARQVNSGRKTPLIQWDKQPLEGFESAPIAELAARHDLLVLDHPHIGEAVAEECLIPLEDLYSAGQISQWRAQSVGPSLASYEWQGQHWAIPLDVATQVMVRRVDLVAKAPGDWGAVLELARRRPVAQSLSGPHAFLTLISMAAAEGHWIGGEDMLPDTATAAALEIIHLLYELRPAGSETANPIRLLETMATSDQIALIPLVFGYVTYSGSEKYRHRLTFSDSLKSLRGAGGVLGGTGIAFTRRCRPDQALLDHIAWLLMPETQSGMIQAFGGQPSARQAWQDIQVNSIWGDFYSATLKTAEAALLRPRFDGYVAFQNKASARIRMAIETNEREELTIRALKEEWQRARSSARGDSDDKRGPKND